MYVCMYVIIKIAYGESNGRVADDVT